MADIFEKVGENQLKRTTPSETVYDYDVLLSERQEVLRKLAALDALIAQADALGVKAKIAIDAIDEQVK